MQACLLPERFTENAEKIVEIYQYLPFALFVYMYWSYICVNNLIYSTVLQVQYFPLNGGRSVFG